jgi:fumarate hydratase subunit alpha
MKEITTDTIINTVEKLAIDACYHLGSDVRDLLEDAREKETSPLGINVLEHLLKNIEVSEEIQLPLCQDTGMAVVFLELGQDVHIKGGSLYEAINEGIRRGYRKGHMRKSVLSPLQRQNTGDNTPAVIHTQITDGDNLKITVAPKGFGSENMSRLAMLPPSAGIEGVKDFILETVNRAGANPCPPIILGVGIGGTMEKAALIAKKALIRRAGTPHADPEVARLEREMLDRINQTGIGPQGLGGKTTALAIHIEIFPTHIAGLPVAVNVQCHAARHAEAVL